MGGGSDCKYLGPTFRFGISYFSNLNYETFDGILSTSNLVDTFGAAFIGYGGFTTNFILSTFA